MELVIYGQRRPLGGKLRMPEEASLFGEKCMPGSIGLVRGSISKSSIIAENLEDRVYYTNKFVSRVGTQKQVKLDIHWGSLRVPVDAQRVPTKKAAPSSRHIEDIVMAEDQTEFVNS